VSDFRIEKLARHHGVDEFDCGEDSLNRFLIRFAWTSQQASASQTYVGLAEETVIGFYTLTVGAVTFEGAPARLVKGLARHPVPVMVLARMAVQQGWQGRGVGAGLVKDAMLRTLAAADIAGIRAVVVHAKNENARYFYEHLGFEAFTEVPLTLYRLMKDIRAMASARER
jgi:GNAT superfamily N-acetyltransferase